LREEKKFSKYIKEIEGILAIKKVKLDVNELVFSSRV
jgi:hypothetical protein